MNPMIVFVVGCCIILPLAVIGYYLIITRGERWSR